MAQANIAVNFFQLKGAISLHLVPAVPLPRLGPTSSKDQGAILIPTLASIPLWDNAALPSVVLQQSIRSQIEVLAGHVAPEVAGFGRRRLANTDAIEAGIKVPEFYAGAAAPSSVSAGVRFVEPLCL
jgi:hypothetical protein